MAWIVYKVFMDGVNRVMEQNAISYQLFASLTFSTKTLFAPCYAINAIWCAVGADGSSSGLACLHYTCLAS